MKKLVDNDDIYNDIMHLFFLYVEGIVNLYEFLELVNPILEPYPQEIFATLKQIVSSRDVSRRTLNWFCRPFSEFDTTQFNKVSFSYYELPETFPQPYCSGKDQLCYSLLNDKYASFPFGSENFKYKLRNLFEENLFNLEDEMYNWDHQI